MVYSLGSDLMGSTSSTQYREEYSETSVECISHEFTIFISSAPATLVKRDCPRPVAEKVPVGWIARSRSEFKSHEWVRRWGWIVFEYNSKNSSTSEHQADVKTGGEQWTRQK